jgi:hypothetical protein
MQECWRESAILASQCACMRTVVRRLVACDSKPLLTPRPAGSNHKLHKLKNTLLGVF